MRHNIYRHQLFSGAEQAAIKFHGAIDTRIVNNHIYNANLAIWLDWMSQGTQVQGNLLHSNNYDLYLEVNHGPTLVANNIMLSRVSLRVKSSGVAFVHNLIGGRIEAFAFNQRKTPYLKPHSTEIVDLEYNPSGSVQFYNNLFVRRADASQYKWALLPVVFDGNVYTKGTVMATPGVGRDMDTDADGYDERAQEALNKYKKQDAVIRNTLAAMEFDAAVNLSRSDQKVFLAIALDENWLAQKWELVTTSILPNAVIPDLPYVNPDGSPVVINTDYFGNKRNRNNPSPGPFEVTKSGKQSLQVWPVKR